MDESREDSDGDWDDERFDEEEAAEDETDVEAADSEDVETEEACGGEWDCKEPEGECGNSSLGECEVGMYCGEDQQCHPGCGTHADCSSGQYCEDHACLAAHRDLAAGLCHAT